ncbi:TPA: FRG domain-containing protein, partial [Klebsiella pneumoniae]|nr:FRG domain-containing protein [Klebsiella pneumoniae]
LADNHGLKVPNVEKLRNSLIGRYDYNFTQQGRIEWLSQDILEVAALAQHYGIPTRLLDWSYDPFVSSYFAASGVTDDSGNLAVWCFNAEYLSTWLNLNSRLKLKLIIPPYSENSNLSAQRGLFTHMPVEFDFSNNDNASIPVDRTPLDIKLDNILPPEPYTQNREKIFLKLTLPCSKAKDLLK